jgi:hypothetical protein
VCKQCSSTCKDAPSEREPLLIDCQFCGGKDDKCKHCGGWGHQRITQCPRKLITPDIWRLLQLAEFAEKGAFPVSGGVLEQSDSFLSACRSVWQEVSYWKAKAGIK